MAFVNLLLRAMDEPTLALLVPAMELIPLKARDTLASAGGHSEWVYFVEDGLISLVSEYEPGTVIEVAMVGREGLFDIGHALGDNVAAFDGKVQVDGSAYRLPRAVFQQAMETIPSFNATMLTFVRAFELQVASTVSANGRARLEERLARWLLMVHDRVDSNLIHITHEFLAQMLCCRRPGVTVALHLLEGKGMIHSSRGQIEIRDRDGLIAEANGAYGRAEAHYTRLFGQDFRRRQG
ncbi:cAMP-binding domain of CRP or a regulatory subunit of cAMP-dependent protein kinases [Devosia sp. YR412]|uniref:Crp/Fnr family transcriptional regulator n=1 Tax=Devosia sp. YR412 TaxID=1881030 RepID=UPI0008B3E25A|nr:Crp/Fnr family transcriptional regulator [Devosia sp. YR412]SEQ02713.1 cAMP-binding domain of CRP or a regulatory subunit of cAMP-dependent protein kinases [Devosia sp. YR412]